MAEAHLTKNGFYVETVEADFIEGEGTFTPLPEFDAETEVPQFVGVGWIVVPLSVRDAYVPPAAPPAAVPASVTMRQARIALSRAGVLKAAEEAIAAMPGQPGEEARIEWAFAAELRRDHPLVTNLGDTLGLGAAAVDDLFRSAASL